MTLIELYNHLSKGKIDINEYYEKCEISLRDNKIYIHRSLFTSAFVTDLIKAIPADFLWYIANRFSIEANSNLIYFIIYK